jgi:hypothetical protein
VLCSVAEIPENVPSVTVTSLPDTMSEPPKSVSRSVKTHQALRGSEERPTHNPEYAISESEVSTTTVAPKMNGDIKEVGIWCCMCQ